MARIVKKKRGIFERPKGSGVWWICYFDQFGTKHWEKVGLRSAAVNQYQRRKVEVTQKKFDPDEIEGKDRNATVGQIVEDYLKASESAGRRAMKDIRIRALYWKGLWPDKSAQSIMPSDIENAPFGTGKKQAQVQQT